MTKRKKIFNKFNGLCAYSGTPLEPDWQVDHVVPIRHLQFLMMDVNNIDNLFPCQKIINHYKRSLNVDQFRNLWLGSLHKRLSKLPKNPKSHNGIKRKEYLLKVASYFDITPDKPFCGKFYFEMIKEQENAKIHIEASNQVPPQEK